MGHSGHSMDRGLYGHSLRRFCVPLLQHSPASPLNIRYSHTLTLLLTLSLHLSFIFSSAAGFPSSQYVDSLFAFKNKVSDPSKLSSWKDSTSPCEWNLISCDKNSGEIVSIDLSSCGFEGSIPVELFNITSLRRLNLSNNRFVGSIPSSISELVNLEYLDMNTNKLSLPIPFGLSRLSNLKYLDLNSNSLNGSLPDDFFSIASLEYLDIGFNKISGSISSEIGKMTKLNHLDMNANSFSGSIPKAISQLSPLEYLDLSMNFLSGELPVELANMYSLRYINLSFNKLVGIIPPQLGNLRNLSSLDLNENQLNGPIPLELGDCPLVDLLLGNNQLNDIIPPSMFDKLVDSLQLLELSYNKLTGTIPVELTKLRKILSIDISNNQLSGSIPEGFGKIPNLNLAMGNNNLTGVVPQDLILSQNIFFLSINNTGIEGVLPKFNCSNLFTLQLVGNNLEGEIPSFEHCNLDELQLQRNRFNGSVPLLPPSIRVLVLRNNQLSGSLPEFKVSRIDGAKSSFSSSSLGSFPSLQFIDISDNFLNGSLPLGLFDLPELLTIDLSNNQLTGNLPNNFNCPQLFILRLKNNQLDGELPFSIFKCKLLQIIDLRGNKFSGSLPEQFTRMASLVTLLLSNNNFSGPLPSSIGNADSLEEVDMSGNHLSGNIPDGFQGLGNLMTLNLSSNRINGSILPQIANLSSLQVLDFSNNDLKGEIPTELGQLVQLKTLFLFNNRLSGFIPNSVLNLRNLINLNVSYNFLEGTIPFIYIKKFHQSAFTYNSRLCLEESGSCWETSPKSKLILYPFIVSGVTIVFFLLIFVLIIQLRVSCLKGFKSGGELVLFQKLDFPLTFQDIIVATDSFHKKNLIGTGGFGEVYKALLPDSKTHVAVKRLLQTSQQGEKEFVSEMQTLGNVKHRNLVLLIGAYSDPVGLDRFLIYEYMSGGSLEAMFESNHPDRDHRFDMWNTRLSIALSVAHGLKYLHHDCKTKIIHRDLKPSNILLDKEMIAHISDFGLARTLRPAITHLSTSAFGTVGYMSLEYARKGKATEKSDVYAFGIILLQLITGKRPTDEGFAYEGLRHWVATNPTFGVVDWRMEIGESMQQVLGMIRLGLLCTSDLPAERPYMAEVAHILENLKEFSSTFEVDGYP